MKPEGFVLGQDPEAKSEELAAKEDGCAQCHKQWPSVTFREMAAEFSGGNPSPEVICDSCRAKREQAVAEKIDEATGETPVSLLTRTVVVSEIESRSNVTAFSYATHHGQKELTITELVVYFKSKTSEPVGPIYVYHNVPVAVCEAWFAAPQNGQSFGEFFREQIYKSYSYERKS